MTRPTPPDGYETWLDYALVMPTSFNQLARAELATLREKAAKWDEHEANLDAARNHEENARWH